MSGKVPGKQDGQAGIAEADQQQTSQTRRTPRQQLLDWFANQNWKAFPFQKQVWRDYLAGKSGLIHAATGTGKTYAAFGGPLINALKRRSATSKRKASRCRVIWITPLRALATDLAHALNRPLQDLELEWTVETRTGDTPAAVRNRQARRLPEVLITTPESLTLLLSRKNGKELLDDLECVIVDEWHELLATKRGVQTELALSRLRMWNPQLRVWGLSATIGNLNEAADVLMGASPLEPPVFVAGAKRKKYRISTLIPDSIERFPWAGHLGLKQLPGIVERIDEAGTSLVFTNTRSQAEIWYQSILKQRPDWAGQLALHHGSIGRETRSWVEKGLRTGDLRCVVCTSSLDLGVDFSPVERVFQIGSPKGIARLMQRAGRSGHSPGETSEVICVPTNALELIEFAAARQALEQAQVESRPPLNKPLDVLIQHLCTIALGGGFSATELYNEIRTSWAYSDLTREEWDWCLDFITTGGAALKAYPDYQRVELVDGAYRLENKKRARQHRLSIGTICGDGTLTVKYLKGGRIGTIEESFISKLNRGDLFTFSGKALEFVTINNMTVWVRKAKKQATVVPRWMGGRMPLSTELADSFLDTLQSYSAGHQVPREVTAVKDILELQQDWSRLPSDEELLIEQIKSREGHHLFFFPLAGRLVHEGLSGLIAYRLSQRQPVSFTISINDYGFELLSPTPVDLPADLRADLFSEDNLTEDMQSCLNAAEMAKRRFREIAQISGLVFNGYPGQQRTTRQLQASTGLLYDVFDNYDQQNLLLLQAKREVLEQQLELTRLRKTLQRMQASQLHVTHPPRLTPFAFPLFVDRLRQRLSSEQLQDRIARMTVQLEKASRR